MNKENLAFPYTGFKENHKGLTKREYIATKILAGLCSNSSINPKDKNHIETIVNLTDELMK